MADVIERVVAAVRRGRAALAREVLDRINDSGYGCDTAGQKYGCGYAELVYEIRADMIAQMKECRMDQKLKPLGDQVLVRPKAEDETSTGGIVIPEVARHPEAGVKVGTVLGVGPGRLLDSEIWSTPGVEEGAVVFYHERSATQVTVEGVDLDVVPSSGLICAVEG